MKAVQKAHLLQCTVPKPRGSHPSACSGTPISFAALKEHSHHGHAEQINLSHDSHVLNSTVLLHPQQCNALQTEYVCILSLVVPSRFNCRGNYQPTDMLHREGSVAMGNQWHTN